MWCLGTNNQAATTPGFKATLGSGAQLGLSWGPGQLSEVGRGGGWGQSKWKGCLRASGKRRGLLRGQEELTLKLLLLQLPLPAL